MNSHIDYIENSHDYDSSVFTAEEIKKLGLQLNDPKADMKLKKITLAILAHRGDLQSYNILKEYAEHLDEGLEEWAKLAFGECTLFLHGDICGDEDSKFVFTGVGKYNNMTRIYLLVLPLEGKLLEAWQHDIIQKEMTYKAQELMCETIEWFDYKTHYVGLSLLLPTNVSVARFIDPAIAACNVFGDFLIPEYFAGTGIPDNYEIEEIIDIVYHGDGSDSFVSEIQPF